MAGDNAVRRSMKGLLSLACLLAVCLVTLCYATSRGERTEGRRQEALEYISDARHVHQQWVEMLTICGDACDSLTLTAGGIEYHREWVRRYNIVLKELETCGE